MYNSFKEYSEMVHGNKVLKLLKIKNSAKLYLSPYNLAQNSCIICKVQARRFWLARQHIPIQKPFCLLVVEKIFYKLYTIWLVHAEVEN